MLECTIVLDSFSKTYAMTGGAATRRCPSRSLVLTRFSSSTLTFARSAPGGLPASQLGRRTARARGATSSQARGRPRASPAGSRTAVDVSLTAWPTSGVAPPSTAFGAALAAVDAAPLAEGRAHARLPRAPVGRRNAIDWRGWAGPATPARGRRARAARRDPHRTPCTRRGRASPGCDGADRHIHRADHRVLCSSRAKPTLTMPTRPRGRGTRAAARVHGLRNAGDRAAFHARHRLRPLHGARCAMAGRRRSTRRSPAVPGSAGPRTRLLAAECRPAPRAGRAARRHRRGRHRRDARRPDCTTPRRVVVGLRGARGASATARSTAGPARG